MRFLFAILLIFSACVRGAETELPETVAVYAAHPLYGGRNVFIHKDGTLWEQVISPPRKNEAGLQEKIFKAELDAAGWASVLKVLDENNFGALKNSERAGIPDEARTTLVVGYGAGQNKSVWKWAGDKDKPFDALRDALARIGKLAEKNKPILEGAFNYRWRPPGFAAGEGGAVAAFSELPKLYDTILVGKVKEVRNRTSDIEDNRKFAVVVNVTEMLQGEAVPGGVITLYIHSAVREFGSYDKLEELSGRDCVYALERDGERVFKLHQPFLFHQFKADDLAVLRRAVQAHHTALTVKAPRVADPEEGGVAKLTDAEREKLWKMLSSTEDADRRKAMEALRPQLKEGMRIEDALKLFPVDFFSKTPQDDGKVRYEAYLGGKTELMYFRLYTSPLGDLVKFGYTGG